MSFVDRLTQDIKEAMKAKEKTKVSVLRMLKASLQNEAIKLGKDLNDLSEDEALTVLGRELKQRKDSLQEFENAGREDLVDSVKLEIAVLEVYMPPPLTDDELEQIVEATIAETNAKSMADMGKVMSAIMPKVKGKADGGNVNRIVKMRLSE